MKTVLLAMCLGMSLSAQTARADDWPQWRGPARDGHAATSAPSPQRLPGEATPVWRLPVAGGYSSPVVAGNTVIYFDGADGQETVHAVDARTGKAFWHIPITPAFHDEWNAGPRSTPMVDGDRVYVQACNGEFRCLRLADGSVLWQTSFEKDFGVKFLGSGSKEGTATRRGNNGCGVIDGSRLVLPVGGTNGCSLACFDKLSGKVLWKSGNDEAAYSSFVTATLAGVRQVVAFTADALLGARLEDGQILWRVPLKTGAKRHAATPVVFGDFVVVNSSTIGLVCFKITSDGPGLKAVPAWSNRALRINLSTPVLVDGFLYSQGASKDFVCVDAATGTLKWSQPGFGKGEKDNASIIVAGRRLLVLLDDGQLLLLETDSVKYRELGRLQVCGPHWCHPAYSGGRLYFRDAKMLYGLDLPDK
jgi:outer membrane protein assembly factor BamB